MREQDSRANPQNNSDRPPQQRRNPNGRPPQRSGEHPPRRSPSRPPQQNRQGGPPQHRQGASPQQSRPSRPSQGGGNRRPAQRPEGQPPVRPRSAGGQANERGGAAPPRSRTTRPSARRRDYGDQYGGSKMPDRRYVTDEMDDMMSYSGRGSRQKKKSVGKKIFLSLFMIAVIVGVAGFLFLNSLISRITYEEPNADVYTPGVKTSAAVAARDIPMSSSGSVTNILLLGSDSGDSGRSDTILLVSIDAKNKKIKMTSFLRDLYVEIPDYHTTRINAAFSNGGPDRVIQTVEANFRVKIDAYFRLDFKSMATLVDEVGGIECELKKKEADYITKKAKIQTQVPEGGGKIRLNGYQALWYCRIRKLDSDFGRTGRQRQFIEFMLKDFKSRNLAEKYSFLHNMMPYLITRDDTQGKMYGFLIAAFFALGYETEEMHVPVDGGYSSQTIGGAAVLVPDIPKNCEAVKEFIYG